MPKRDAGNRTAVTVDVKPAITPATAEPAAKPEPPAKPERAQGVESKEPTKPADAVVTSASLASRALPQEAAATTATAPFDVTPTATAPEVSSPPQLTALVAQPRVPLLNLLGTLVINALSFVVQLFDPPPVVPPGSSVTIGRAQLAVPCDCRAVDARWYFPNQDEEPTGVTYLQHGFFRSNANVSALAVQLAEETNTIVVAPTITSNFFAVGGFWINGDPMHRAIAALFTDPDRTALQASATAAAIDAGMLSPGQTLTLPDQFVLAGHSAGGNLVAAVAGYIAESGSDDLRAVIMFDGVDNGGAIGAGVRKLPEAVPVYQIASPCGLCNGFGSGTTALEAARPGQFVGVLLEHGTHIDAEGASSGFPAKLVCGFPRSRNVDAVQILAGGWIVDALHPQDPPIGVYGTPGSTISVPTPAGTATAQVLGQAPAEARPSSAPVQTTVAA
ncbi:MAG: alpha/beta hydrolase [Mycobacterium sp.]